jgi:hypothetical protein
VFDRTGHFRLKSESRVSQSNKQNMLFLFSSVITSSLTAGTPAIKIISVFFYKVFWLLDEPFRPYVTSITVVI